MCGAKEKDYFPLFADDFLRLYLSYYFIPIVEGFPPGIGLSK